MRIVAIWAAWFSGLAAWLPSFESDAADRNVLVIVADDLGLDLGCYGNEAVRTPHIDRLANRGTRFTNAYCTTSSCSASRSVILTGLHNHANGQFGHAHAPSNFHTHEWVKSLPALLRQANYRSLCLGKLHVQPDNVYPFDVWAAHEKAQTRSPEAFAKNAEQFIKQDPTRPFFIYACSVDPHRNFDNGRIHDGETPVEYDADDVRPPDFLPNSSECRKELAEYYQAVSRLDQLVGRLFAVLEATGHLEDTLIVFLSDNGPPFSGAKTTLYEPGVRLPLIICTRSPALSAATRDELVSWVDVAPTILEFAGVKPPSYPLHGKSLMSLLESQAESRKDQEIFFSHTFHAIQQYFPMRALRRGNLKYILNVAHPLQFPAASDLFESATWQAAVRNNERTFGLRSVDSYLHRPRHELYDLAGDPNELSNLADDPRFAGQLRLLQDRLRAWQIQTKDPWVSKYDYE